MFPTFFWNIKGGKPTEAKPTIVQTARLWSKTKADTLFSSFHYTLIMSSYNKSTIYIYTQTALLLRPAILSQITENVHKCLKVNLAEKYTFHFWLS